MAQSAAGAGLFKELIKTVSKTISSFLGRIFSKIIPGVRLPKFTKSLLEGLLITVLAWGISYGFMEVLAASALIASLGPVGAGVVFALLGIVVLLFLYYGIIKPSYLHYRTYQANLKTFQETIETTRAKINSEPALSNNLKHGTKERAQYLKEKQQEWQKALKPLSSIAPELTINAMEWETIRDALEDLELPENHSELNDAKKAELRSVLKENADNKTKRLVLRALLHDSDNPKAPIPTSKLLQEISPDTSSEFITRLKIMEAFQSGDVKALQALYSNKSTEEILVAADIASRVNRALAGGRLINGEVIEKEVDADTPNLIADTVLQRGVALTYAQVCLFEEIISIEEPELDTSRPDPATPAALVATPQAVDATKAHSPDHSPELRSASRPGSSPARDPDGH